MGRDIIDKRYIENKITRNVKCNKSKIYDKSIIKDNVKNSSGITLIALVITIVLIIILATITINFAFGDDGLINMAELARDEATNSTSYETDAMKNLVAYMNEYRSEINGGSGSEEPEEDITGPTVTIIEGEITENSIAVNVIANDPESGLASTNAYVYYLNGVEQIRSNSSSYTFSGLTASTSYTIKVEVYNRVGIKGEDSVTISTSAKPGLSAADIKADATNTYGKEVTGYNETRNSVEIWRIFYADENNIYLIADDYIEPADAPRGKKNTAVNSYGMRYIGFTNVVNDYVGASDIGASNPARKWLDTYLDSSYGTSTNDNMKATAYLMDTNVWSNYYGDEENNAEYVIGGPTLELFCESYSDTHNPGLDCNNVGPDGYRIKFSNNSSYSSRIIIPVTDEYHSIYIKSDITNALAMWLASPSTYGNTGLFCAECTGYVSGNTIDDDDRYGLRPLVCLKSSVQLERVDSDTFRIVE